MGVPGNLPGATLSMTTPLWVSKPICLQFLGEHDCVGEGRLLFPCLAQRNLFCHHQADEGRIRWVGSQGTVFMVVTAGGQGWAGAVVIKSLSLRSKVWQNFFSRFLLLLLLLLLIARQLECPGQFCPSRKEKSPGLSASFSTWGKSKICPKTEVRELPVGSNFKQSLSFAPHPGTQHPGSRCELQKPKDRALC